jgi:hypothetical protein
MFYSAFVVFSVACDHTIFRMDSFCRLLITAIKQKTIVIVHLPCFYFMLCTIIAIIHCVIAVSRLDIRHEFHVGGTLLSLLFLS